MLTVYNKISMEKLSKKSSKPNKFLLRLYNILEDPRHSNVISWSDSGTSFIISSVPELTETVLPLHFKHKNFSSFVRQLNMYDFHKERATNDVQIYTHPCFVRGDKEKLAFVHRKTSDLYIESKPGTTLETKYNIISSKQKLLDEKISILENNYKEVANCNQSLLHQIFQTCQREQKIEQLLYMFIKQVNEIPPFLEPFYKQKSESEIVRPVPIPLNYQFTNSLEFSSP